MSGDLKERLPAAGATPGTAVEKADKPPTLAQVVRRMIDTQAVAFKQVLPGTVDPERFSRLVLTAVKASPGLMECFGTTQGQTSVLLSAMDCAALGLEPNTPTQDAWLLPRRNKGVTECELSIGYRGLCKLARRSGIVKSIRADVVHERDEFHWEYGLDEDVLKHLPYRGDEDPGALTYAYAVVRFTNGGSQFIVLHRRDVEKRRAMSSSWTNEKARPYSPWTKWEDEMWKKTAVRALVPYLELSPEASTVVSHDERRLHVNDDGVIDIADDDSPFAEIGAGSPAEGEPDGLAGPSDEAAKEAVPPAADSPSGGSSPAEFVPMLQPQNKALHALLKRKYSAEGDQRHAVVSELLDRDISSMNEVSKDEASRLIDRLQEMPDEKPASDG